MRVRINFALSEYLKDWIKQQPGVLQQVEETNASVTFEVNLTGPQAQALKSAFIDKLIEVI